jgi:8-oxo-dGTP pyrophosphatase MutT (NUDIX family)
MLDLDIARESAPPRDAATLVLVRDAPEGRLEVFCVQRHTKSAFLGGAVVFPGGKVDAADLDPRWADRATAPRPASFASGGVELRGLSVAACREALEEAAILPLANGTLSHEELVSLRARAKETSLLACLVERALTVDLAALHPLARWVTPTAESRRFDTRFFIVIAPPGQPGAHDDRETTASFWATPRETIDRFLAGAVQLAPPTHRTLELLTGTRTAEHALRLAEKANLAPICPRLVRHVDGAVDTMALVLPGDPEHEVSEVRVPGASRYVLTGDRWLPGGAPAQRPSESR